MSTSAVADVGRATWTLKTWPEQWDAIAAGLKTADIRTTGGRSFAVGDVLVFVRTPRPRRAGDPAPEICAPLELRAEITWINRTAGPQKLFGLDLGDAFGGDLQPMAVLSFRRIA